MAGVMPKRASGFRAVPTVLRASTRSRWASGGKRRVGFRASQLRHFAMRIGPLPAILAFFQLTAMALVHKQDPPSWQDPSPHRVQFVTVEDGVKVEVLDWGGIGRPVVLLGGYLTAHSYDDFAPQLTQLFHVYGITRRGFGASSKPESGYTAQRSADDVLRVLDLLKLEKVILMGHSFGGQDLSTLGAQNADRVGAVVYLNSAEDPTVTDYGVKPPDPGRLPTPAHREPPPDYSSFAAYRRWQRETRGGAFPETELRQLFAANLDGSMGQYLPQQRVRDAIFAGRAKPDYAAIHVPVLAFFAPGPTFDEFVRQFPPKTPDQRAAVEEQYRYGQAIYARHLSDLRRGVPSARIVELPHANFYIFVSNGPDIVREVQTFAAKLPE